MTWLRPVVALLGLAVLGLALTLGVVSEVDRHRKADRLLAGRLEALEARVLELDLLLAEHEAWAWEEAEAVREAAMRRCSWSLVPRRTRRELVTAVWLHADGDKAVYVDIAR